ncbi:uncharacterized protein LOC129722903 [Wyeomyia smithii]|uniref:uncharacterized protein LOC129722903 n=1 Tax=Wyeomyia smithii TaxID=174621 RepID=UPI002467FF0D|nr:uncharacterized protein LOC129722903 [Wyeomyia smithii]
MRHSILLVCYLAAVSGRSFTDVRRRLRSDVAYNQRNHRQGQFKYGYAVKQGETQFHHQRSLDGAMYGCYGFVDPLGKLFITHYLADVAGYRLVNMANPDRKLIERLKNEGTAENPIDVQKLFPQECQDDGDIVMLQQSAEKMKTSYVSEDSVLETGKTTILKPLEKAVPTNDNESGAFTENKIEPAVEVSVQGIEQPSGSIDDANAASDGDNTVENIASVVEDFEQTKEENHHLLTDQDPPVPFSLAAKSLPQIVETNAVWTTTQVPESVTEVTASGSDKTDTFDVNSSTELLTTTAMPSDDLDSLEETGHTDSNMIDEVPTTTVAPVEVTESVSLHSPEKVDETPFRDQPAVENDSPQEDLKFDDVEYSFVPIPVTTDSPNEDGADESEKSNETMFENLEHIEPDSVQKDVQNDASVKIQTDFVSVDNQQMPVVVIEPKVESIQQNSDPIVDSHPHDEAETELSKLNNRQTSETNQTSKPQTVLDEIRTVFRGNIKYSNSAPVATKNVNDKNDKKQGPTVFASVSASTDRSVVRDAVQDGESTSVGNMLDDNLQLQNKPSKDNEPTSPLKSDRHSLEYAFSTRSKPENVMPSIGNIGVVDQDDNRFGELLRSLNRREPIDERNDNKESTLHQSRIGPLPNFNQFELDDTHSSDLSDGYRAINSKLPATPRPDSSYVAGGFIFPPTIASGTDRVPMMPNPTVDFRPFTPNYHPQIKPMLERAGSTIGSNGDIYDEIEEDVDQAAVANRHVTKPGDKTISTEPSTFVTSTPASTSTTTTTSTTSTTAEPPSSVSSVDRNSHCHVVMLTIPINAQRVIIKTDSPQFRVYGRGDPEERIKMVEPGVYEVNVGSTSSIKFQQYGFPPTFVQQNKLRLDLGKNFNYDDLVPTPLYNRRIYQQEPMQLAPDSMTDLNNPYLPLNNEAAIPSVASSQARSVGMPEQSVPTEDQNSLTTDQRALLSLVPSWKKVLLYY